MPDERLSDGRINAMAGGSRPDYLADELKLMARELQHLRKVLPWVRHKRRCGVNIGLAHDRKCTCGLDKFPEWVMGGGA